MQRNLRAHEAEITASAPCRIFWVKSVTFFFPSREPACQPTRHAHPQRTGMARGFCLARGRAAKQRRDRQVTVVESASGRQPGAREGWVDARACPVQPSIHP
jgi:hypothetical protein